MRPALAALLLAGCAEIGLEPGGVPPPPKPRPVLRPARAASATFGASLIARRRVDGVKAVVLVVGEGQVRGNLVSELKSPEARLKPPLLAVLIQHPKEGAILYGAGLPAELNGRRVKGSALSPFKVEPGQELYARLKAVGVTPEDVKTVILPDLAPEWAGGAGGFPNATIVISSQAWVNPRRRSLEKDMPDPRAYIPEERLKTKDLSVAPPYGTFDHGLDLFGDGTVILIDVDGGVSGGMAAWVNLDSGPLLLAGPGAFVYDNVFDSALPDAKFVVDVSSFMWGARAMKDAADAAPRLVILPAHDLSTLALSPRPDISLVR